MTSIGSIGRGGLGLAGAVAVLALAACGSSTSTSTGTSSATASTSAAQCSKGSLSLHSTGVLTVATDAPAYPPYFENNKPANGKGFESAVAYAIADKLGLRARRGQVDGRAVRQLLRARPEVVRLRHQRDLDHAAAREGGRLLDALLHEPAGDRRRQGLERWPARAASPRCAARSSACRSARRASKRERPINPSQQPQVFNNSNDVVSALQEPQRRRDRRRPRDRVLPHLRRDPARRDRRPVQRARRRQLGRAAREALEADAVRRSGALGTLRANGTLARSPRPLDAVRRRRARAD